jgi:hypothetical protein
VCFVSVVDPSPALVGGVHVSCFRPGTTFEYERVSGGRAAEKFGDAHVRASPATRARVDIHIWAVETETQQREHIAVVHRTTVKEAN